MIPKNLSGNARKETGNLFRLCSKIIIKIKLFGKPVSGDETWVSNMNRHEMLKTLMEKPSIKS
jgi:hypothetical protein